MIRTKSVTTPIDRKRDGLRILVARFRGRGLSASRYDVWMPSLGPSEKLLRSVLSEKISWPEFAREYRRELFMPAAVDARNASIKNHGQKFTLRLLRELARRQPVTLMCHCAEDAEHCHRYELQALLQSHLI